MHSPARGADRAADTGSTASAMASPKYALVSPWSAERQERAIATDSGSPSRRSGGPQHFPQQTLHSPHSPHSPHVPQGTRAGADPQQSPAAAGSAPMGPGPHGAAHDWVGGSVLPTSAESIAGKQSTLKPGVFSPNNHTGERERLTVAQKGALYQAQEVISTGPRDVRQLTSSVPFAFEPHGPSAEQQAGASAVRGGAGEPAGSSRDGRDTDTLLLISSRVPCGDALARAHLARASVEFFDPDAASADPLRDTVARAASGGRLERIGVVDHGAPGELLLCRTVSIGRRAPGAPVDVPRPVIDLVRFFSAYLSPGGSIDLLACNVAESDAGKRLASEVQAAAGVNMNAIGAVRDHYRLTEGRVLEGASLRYFSRVMLSKWGSEVEATLPRGDVRMWLPRSLIAAVPSNMGRADDTLDTLGPASGAAGSSPARAHPDQHPEESGLFGSTQRRGSSFVRSSDPFARLDHDPRDGAVSAPVGQQRRRF